MKFVALSKAMRLPFLILTPVCVLLGLSVVIASQREVEGYLLVLTLLVAMFAHVSVNALNEYFDFSNGLDLKTLRTPFSGGSGALPQHPEMAVAVLILGLGSLLATVLLGAFFVWKYGAAVMPLGVAGLLLVAAYTPWITKRPFLCLIGPGLGFGFLMVAGTHFAMTGEYSTLSWQVAVVPFFLVNNLLLLNQYPDIHADRSVGRNNILIAYGTQLGSVVYGVFATLAMAAIVLLAGSGIVPALSLIALLPMPLAFFALSGAVKYGEAIGNYPHFLLANVLVALLTPALLGVAIIFG